MNDRERLGKAVCDAWRASHPERQFLATWEELNDFDRETDCLIAEAVLREHAASLPLPAELEEIRTRAEIIASSKNYLGMYGEQYKTDVRKLVRYAAAQEAQGRAMRDALERTHQHLGDRYESLECDGPDHCIVAAALASPLGRTPPGGST